MSAVFRNLCKMARPDFCLKPATQTVLPKTLEIYKNPELLKSLGQNAQERALTGFSSQTIVHKYVDYYKKSLKNVKVYFFRVTKNTKPI